MDSSKRTKRGGIALFSSTNDDCSVQDNILVNLCKAAVSELLPASGLEVVQDYRSWQSTWQMSALYVLANALSSATQRAFEVPLFFHIQVPRAQFYQRKPDMKLAGQPKHQGLRFIQPTSSLISSQCLLLHPRSRNPASQHRLRPRNVQCIAASADAAWPLPKSSPALGSKRGDIYPRGTQARRDSACVRARPI